MSRSSVVSLLAAVALSAVACGGNEPLSGQRRHTVEIREFQFHPASLTVEPGDTVEWTNRDAVPHTVTGAEGGWDSGPIAAGDSWIRIASETMADAYICSFHPTMIGHIEVE